MGTETRTTAVIVGRDRRLRRYVTRALAAADFDVHESSPEEAHLEKDALFIIDGEQPEEEIRALLDQLGSERCGKVVVLSRDMESPLVNTLLSNHGVNHYIARHSDPSERMDLVDEAELITTCNKIMTGDLFGLTKYIAAWGIRIHHHRIGRVTDKFAATAGLETFLERIDCVRSIMPTVALVAEELLMNAIFNAPRTAQGGSKHGSTDRAEMVILEPHEYADFYYGCDGRHVALAVEDPFGSLRLEEIVKYLGDCFLGKQGKIEDKKGGAGLGLYMIYNSCSQLIFNIEPGKRTEIVALFYIRGGAKAFRRASRSLNIFLR